MAPRRGRADPHSLAGPYALNALSPREATRFERHLAGCAECAEELRGLRETAAKLAAAAAVQPPARLRDRVLAAAAVTRQLPPAPAGSGKAARHWPSARVGRAPQSWPRLAVTAVAGAFLAAAVAFAVLAVTTQHTLTAERHNDNMLAAVLTSPDARLKTEHVRGGGMASVVMSHRLHALAFSSDGLRRLPRGKAYELWLMGAAGPRPAAMLPALVHGMTSPVVATGLRAGDRVELTIEPSGGASTPALPLLDMPV